ncbi:MAG TPA: ATP-binding protein [Ideonella sp.]|uniref:sensor histidine kinase n=1 Tax=Ideonella sp. TaxID=1929293 RepID=UPI002C3910BF|nr:ATP-binding protein [Ideonella sp.]HSI49481.1 ATP-binding protein [Ideonella sp.]
MLELANQPTIVQRAWLLVVCAMGLGLLLVAVFRICVRRLATRMHGRWEQRMAQQARISRELHDTLLQSTQGLILQFQVVLDNMPQGDPARAALVETLERVDAVLAVGRERVLDLRISAEPLGDLPVAYAATGEALRQGRNVTFKTIVDGTAQELVPKVKAEVYRIGREALLNAFRHAHAANIEVQIVYTDTRLRIRVRDDGTGIDARMFEGEAVDDHGGVFGMQTRAARIGAQLDIWSRPGAGTEVELIISASLAYKFGSSGSRPPSDDDA